MSHFSVRIRGTFGKGLQRMLLLYDIYTYDLPKNLESKLLRISYLSIKLLGD